MLPFSLECNFFNAVIILQAGPAGSWQFYKLFLVWYGVFISYFNSEILALCLAVKINSCRCGLNKLCECGKIEAEYSAFHSTAFYKYTETVYTKTSCFLAALSFFQLHYIVWGFVFHLCNVCVLKGVCSFEDCIKEMRIMAGVRS